MQSPPDTHRRLRRSGVESPRPMPTQFRRTSWLGCSPQPMHRLQATARCRKHDMTPSPRSPSKSPKAPPVALHLFWPLKSPPDLIQRQGSAGWTNQATAALDSSALHSRAVGALYCAAPQIHSLPWRGHGPPWPARTRFRHPSTLGDHPNHTAASQDMSWR